MTELQSELKQAKAHLATLQDELPQFHALLTDNERDAETRKRERASLDTQAQAKNRVMVAREMLEQHGVDIQTAQAEVTRLEGLAHQEQLLVEMTGAALEAKRQREMLEAALAAGNTALLKHLTKIDDAYIGLEGARVHFLDLGGQLSKAFTVTHYPAGWSDEKLKHEEKAAQTVLAEIRTRGIDLNDVLTPVADSRRTSPLDLMHPNRVKEPAPFGHTLYNAIPVLKRHKAEQRA